MITNSQSIKQQHPNNSKLHVFSQGFQSNRRRCLKHIYFSLSAFSNKAYYLNFLSSHFCLLSSVISNEVVQDLISYQCTLRGKSSYSKFFWFVFSCIWTEYGRSIFPYSIQMRENTEQKNSEQRHFSRSGLSLKNFSRQAIFVHYQQLSLSSELAFVKLFLFAFSTL